MKMVYIVNGKKVYDTLQKAMAAAELIYKKTKVFVSVEERRISG